VNATNGSVIRKGYDDFANGDIPAVLEAFDTSITWHVPGHSPLSGKYKGHDEVVGSPTLPGLPAQSHQPHQRILTS
jgi:ketosteroid isomerase-like protein